MMLFSRALWLCLVLAAGTAIADEQESVPDVAGEQELAAGAADSNVPMVAVEKHGIVFKSPYYDPNEKPLPEEITTFHKAVISESLKPMKDILAAALIKGQGMVRLSPTLFSAGMRFFTMSMKYAGKSKELKTKYNIPSDRKFQISSLSILPEFIDLARAKVKDISDDDKKRYKDAEARKEVGRRMLVLLDGIEALVHESPVGTHLDFRHITIGNKPIAEEASEVLIFMQKGGYNWILNKFDELCRKLAAQNEREYMEKKARALTGEYEAETVPSAAAVAA